MLRRPLRVWLLGMMVVGCASEPGNRLDVLVVTDFRAGYDYAFVRAELLGEPYSQDRRLDSGRAFYEPTDAIRFDQLPHFRRYGDEPATRLLRVSLLNERREVIGVSRPVSIPRQREPLQVPVRICAGCSELECGAGATCGCGSRATCVPNECIGEDASCGAPLPCRTDDECRLDLPSSDPRRACTSGLCRSGACLVATDDDACADDEYCSATAGCVPLPWRETARLGGTGFFSDEMTDRGGGLRFGSAVALDASGSLLAVSAPGVDSPVQDTGQIVLFEREGLLWREVSRFGAGEGESFGPGLAFGRGPRLLAIAGDGSRLAFHGAYGDARRPGVYNVGAIRVFDFDPLRGWDDGRTLSNPDPSVLGFGLPLSLGDDGTILAQAREEGVVATWLIGRDGSEVRLPTECVGGGVGLTRSGQVVVSASWRDVDVACAETFHSEGEWSEGVWSTTRLELSSVGPGGDAANSLVVDENGDRFVLKGRDRAIHTFTRRSDSDQYAPDPTSLRPEPLTGWPFGDALALTRDGRRLVVGARDQRSPFPGVDGPEDDDSLEGAGAVYLYDRVTIDGGRWERRVYLKPGQPVRRAAFGASVAVSDDGEVVVVGAPHEVDADPSAAPECRSDRDCDPSVCVAGMCSASAAGAVYVFQRARR